MRTKLKQDTGIEIFLMGIVLFGLFILFFALVTTSNNPSLSKGLTGFILKIVDDGSITKDEITMLKSVDCGELEMLLGKGKKGCIYFKDSNGNIVDISGEGTFGFGCPGLSINGTKICNY